MRNNEKDNVKNIFNEIFNYMNYNYKNEILTVDLFHKIALSIDNMLRYKCRDHYIKDFWIHLYGKRNSYTLDNKINGLEVNHGLGSDFIYQINIKDVNNKIITEYLTIN